jgi:hypothetical protein
LRGDNGTPIGRWFAGHPQDAGIGGRKKAAQCL